MTDVQETVSVPEASDSLAKGISKLVASAIATHKSGASLPAEAMADVMEAIKDLGPALKNAGMLGDELKTDPIGVAEAFAIAGFEMAKSMKAAAPAAPASA